MSKMFDFITGKSSGKVAELEASIEHTAGYLGVEIEENAKLRQAVLAYLSEFDNPVPDPLHRKVLRDRLRKLVGAPDQPIRGPQKR